ncbi:MAG TPA: 23S rRNA (adenine(2030)-N(6))-methyltransferase RlmJ [Castellaniella sp.]|uniref:23S rRNA (adenine(2030)-N(6))-methyltransferase RlmJ n=1 Tax=Castellaniella sp. TaxID=1955812 RepID=UPI002EE9353E
MFSYRHAFHAGNHADVLKHAILVQILDYFNRKEGAYWVIDTHAGGGLYALDGDWAGQSGEVKDGLDRLLAASEPPALISRYLQAVAAFNPDGQANIYPGSPCLALQSMRPQDHLRLFELHTTEIEVLQDTLAHLGKKATRHTQVAHEDGFHGLLRLLPPPPRRGIILIDPPYEDKQDYRHVLTAVREGLQRFAQGCFAIWYPQVQRVQAHEMARSLERLPVDWLHASLSVCKPSEDGLGMHGSGMFIVNPPWTLQAELEEALPWLAQVLAQDSGARFSLTRGTAAPQGSSRAQGQAPLSESPRQKRSPSRR